MRAVALAVLALGFTLLVCVPAWGAELSRRRRLDRPQAAVPELVERNAHANYDLLERAVRLLDGLLREDRRLPVFTEDGDRREARAIVRAFDGNRKRET